MSALLLALQTLVWKTVLLWPGPKGVLSSPNIPKVQGVGRASGSSALAVLAPFQNGCTYVNFSHREEEPTKAVGFILPRGVGVRDQVDLER